MRTWTKEESSQSNEIARPATAPAGAGLPTALSPIFSKTELTSVRWATKGLGSPVSTRRSSIPRSSTLFKELLKSNSVTRRQQRSDNQSLLTGLLFDDRGNRMSPSFSTKHGVRYRFYVSSAILYGRREVAGSVSRVSAPDLESRIVSALRVRFPDLADQNDLELISALIERIVLGREETHVTLKGGGATGSLIVLSRPQPPASPRARIENNDCQSIREPDIGLLQSVARAHLWLKALSDGTYQSIEELASVAKWNPKVIRKALRLAFLAPDITEAIIFGSQPKSLNLSELQGISASWDEQRRLLGLMSSYNVHYGIFPSRAVVCGTPSRHPRPGATYLRIASMTWAL